MTQEDKELLLKDLCARLPYGIKVNNEIQGDFKIYGICENFAFGRNEVCHIDFNIEKIKPYLFPLSSMTEEQSKEFNATLKYLPAEEINFWTLNTYDWCNKNHIDYRGLIPKGLAIDATGLNVY
jgi:hypothetical protein